MSYLNNYSNRAVYKKKWNKENKKWSILRSKNNNLHFNLQNYTQWDSPPSIINDAKGKILRDFAYGFAKVNGASSYCYYTQNMSFDQLYQLLESWNGNNAGQILAQTLSDNIAQKIQNSIYTGAGIEEGFNEAFANTSDNWASVKTKAEAGRQAKFIFEQIEQKLIQHLNLYNDIQDAAMLEKCIDMYNLGQKIKPSIFNKNLTKYNNTMLSITDIRKLSSTTTNSFSKLEQNIYALQDIAKSGPSKEEIQYSGDTPEKDGIRKTPLELARSIAGVFNGIGGTEVGEAVGVYAANLLKKEDLKPIEEQIEKIFNMTPNFTAISAERTGQDKIKIGENTIDPKADWKITLQGRTVSLVIPVSQKLYQSSSSGTFKHPVSNRPLPKKITAQKINLDSLMAITLNDYVSGASWFEQHLAALSNGDNGKVTMSKPENIAINSWNKFKEAAKWMALFRGLVGSGIKLETGGVDFAALLIVNDSIFSIADIFKKYIEQDLSPLEPEIPNFEDMRKTVGGIYSVGTKKSSIDHSDRIAQQKSAISAWWSMKFSIEINLMVAAGLLT